MNNAVLLKYDNNKEIIRHIPSFVRRHRKLSKGQQFALDNLWPLIGVDFQHLQLDLISLFGRDAPTVLEIGFGIGLSLVAMAQQQPQKNFFGIEVYLPGIIACLKSTHQANITNLRIIHHDAFEVVNKMIPEKSLEIVQLFFPDPWQKSKHHKRRLIQSLFAKQIQSKLKIGGFLHIATDWKDYARYILTVMNNIPGYQNISKYNTYITRPDSRPLTKFEIISKNLGHDTWDLMFKRL